MVFDEAVQPMRVLAMTVYTALVTIALLVTPLLLWMPWLYKYRPTCSDKGSPITRSASVPVTIFTLGS